MRRSHSLAILSIFDLWRPCLERAATSRTVWTCEHRGPTEGQLGLGAPGSGTLEDSSSTVQDFLM